MNSSLRVLVSVVGAMTRGRTSLRRLALACTFLVLCVIPAIAVASEAPEGMPGGSFELPLNAAEEAKSAQGSSVSSLTDPQVAAELPHRNLGRGEVLELLEGVFSPALQAPAGPFDSLDVDRFLSANAAIVFPPVADTPMAVSEGGQPEGDHEGSPALLEATVPIRIEAPDGSAESVDLSLKHTGGRIEPVTPIEPVVIPRQLGDGIELPESGISVELVNAPADRAPSIIEESIAAYPNVDTDTDFAVAPTPTGLETLTTLRSAEAPRKQTFRLSLPAGAELIETDEGGAEVSSGDETLLRVAAPSAIDATGASVPVSMQVSGDSMTLTTSPGQGAEYPILVDPLIEAFEWRNGLTTNMAGWYSTSNFGSFATGQAGTQFGLGGPYITAGSGWYPVGGQASWIHPVPRLLEEEQAGRPRPTSYIIRLWEAGLTFSGAVPSSPDIYVGIWNPATQQWAGKWPQQAVWGYPGSFGSFEGASLNIINGTPTERDKNAKQAYGITMLSAGGNPQGSTAMFLGYSTVEVDDVDLPEVGKPTYPETWVDGTSAGPISVSAHDTGLGVKYITFGNGSPGQPPVTAAHPCGGWTANPCPKDWSASLSAGQYSPSSMANGYNRIPVKVRDVLGNETTVNALVPVDHTKPNLALSGALTETAKLGGKLPSYQLNYSATDGDEAAPEMTGTVGASGTGTGQMERPQGVAIDAQGNVWVTDKTNNRVIEYDKSGAFVRQIGTGTGDGQIKEPRGIAVTPAGNVWVAEFAPNKRLQEFNSKGEFIRKVTSAKIIEPWGIAAGPGETIWVADQGAHQLLQFKENGTYLQSTPGGGQNPLTWPIGVAVDRLGNVWTVDESTNKIYEFNSSGNLVQSFSGPGSGEGQLSAPQGIAIAASGNILVVDGGSNRVEEFKPDGTFLRQFGSSGSGTGQFKEPRGIAVGSGNTALVADAGNRRMAKWSHADKDFQSGVGKVEIKVDKQIKFQTGSGCPVQNCKLEGPWTLKTNDYTAGQHEVEVIATDGVNLASAETFKVELQPDLTAPNLTVSGSITEQGSLGTSRPRYKLKLQASDPTAIAKTEVTVDGKVVDSSTGCAGENCTAVREWTLNSDSYSPGSHTVVSKATDGFGNTTSKTTTISIQRDTAKPTITASGALYNAPSGWVDQEGYGFSASAKDAGYGVTSLALKIDGTQVASSSASCADGGCEASVQKTIDMVSYSGGAHPAEVIATDGAGNTSNQKWTINVNPQGNITAEEVIATLEAADETSGSNLVGPSAEDPTIEGTAAGLSFDVEGSEAESEGTEAPISVETSPQGTITIEGAPPVSEVAEEAPEGEGEEGEQPPTEEPESNYLGQLGEFEMDYETIEIDPLAQGGGATDAELAAGTALVGGNSVSNVDTTVRPLFDGAMAFQDIRDAAATETFSWEVRLSKFEEMRQVDEQMVGVYYPDGSVALSMSAEPAHDVTGKAVRTTISASGNILTLTVHHHEGTEDGGPIHYPVLAGAGFEAGYASVEVYIPPPLSEEEGEGGETEIETFEGEPFVRSLRVGAPVNVPNADVPVQYRRVGKKARRRAYNFNQCPYRLAAGEPGIPENTPDGVKYRANTGSWDCSGPMEDNANRKHVVRWAVSQSGLYWYYWGEELWVNHQPDCKVWGEDAPHKINCYSDFTNSSTHIGILGWYRFDAGNWLGGPQETCYELEGTLGTIPPKQENQGRVIHDNFHVYKEARPWHEECDWRHLNQLQ